MIRLYRDSVIILLYLCTILLAQQQTQSPFPDSIPFEERVRYYLNLQTQETMNELVARELQLLQLVQLVRQEISLRGKDGLPAFDLVYSLQDSLIREYGQEMVELMTIYDKLSQLQAIAEYGDDLEALQSIAIAKDNVAGLIQDRDLYTKGIYTAERVGGMIDEYTTEMDTLLGIFDTLERLKVLARANNDEKALNEISEQQNQLYKTFSQWKGMGPLSEEDFLRYQIEAKNVHEVAEGLEETAGVTEEEEARESLRDIKTRLVRELDEDMYDMMIAAGFERQAYPSVPEFIESWQAERLIDVTTKLTEYQVIRNELLINGDQDARERMKTQQITQALLNYADEYYMASEYQLIEVLEIYGNDIKGATAIHFYIGECNYHRMAYDDAKNEYEKVLEIEPVDQYHAEALVRLMQYANDFMGSQQFFQYYQRFLNLAAQADPTLVYYAHFLAANKYFDNRQFSNCQAVLEQIDSDSDFYLPSQLLLAITLINMRDYEKALPVLTFLADKNSYPWTGLNTAYIRNTALIRLGMVHYEQGNYYKAQDVFSRVSQGFQGFDEALIAQAWSYLQTGRYNRAIASSHDLLRNYLASNFTYEALVLSAHCQQLTEQPDQAMNAYRYVVRAHEAMAMQSEFDRERALSTEAIDELEEMERTAIEFKREELYLEINMARDELRDFMAQVREKSDTGTQLIQDYYDERIDILNHIQQLDQVVQWGMEQNREEVVENALKQKDRLLKVLDTFQSDRDIVNTAYLVDYPLAAKEASMDFRRDQFSTVYRDLDLEKRRIENTLDALQQFQDNQELNMHTRMNLELLQKDLDQLNERMSKFHKVLKESLPDVPSSQLAYWNDFSGVKLSEMIFAARKERLETIDTYATHLRVIENVLQDRRNELESRLDQFEDQIRALQQRLMDRKIQLEQMERQTYFEKHYFDTRVTEEEDWESRLRQLLQQ
ncbi:hypothetical protein GF406_03980 [candidate division KSB1 bacterium]|nr:hypothetical protein [candidate division KSB1 bacterium]